MAQSDKFQHQLHQHYRCHLRFTNYNVQIPHLCLLHFICFIVSSEMFKYMTSYQFMLSVLWKWMIIQETVDMCFFYGCADCNHKEARSSPRTFWELMKFFCQGMEEAMQLWHYIGGFRNERGSNLKHGVFQIHVYMNLFCCVEPLHLSQAFKLHCLCWNSYLRCLLVSVDWNRMFLLGGWHSFFIFMRFWVQFLVQRLAIINRFFL